MFVDHSLLPRETIRLAALGLLSENPLTYTDLANEVRRLVGRFAAPSPELSGPSIELFRYEGLVEPVDDSGDPLLRLTDAGSRDLVNLLTATVRPPSTHLSRLVIVLKVRFLYLLDKAERRRQIDGIVEAYSSEIEGLKGYASSSTCVQRTGDFDLWLQHEIDLSTRQIQWFRDFRESIR